jgi:hypothetical protein
MTDFVDDILLQEVWCKLMRPLWHAVCMLDIMVVVATVFS